MPKQSRYRRAPLRAISVCVRASTSRCADRNRVSPTRTPKAAAIAEAATLCLRIEGSRRIRRSEKSAASALCRASVAPRQASRRRQSRSRGVLMCRAMHGEFDGAGDDERIDAILEAHAWCLDDRHHRSRTASARTFVLPASLQRECSEVSGVDASLKKMARWRRCSKRGPTDAPGRDDQLPDAKNKRGYVAELVTLHVRQDAPATPSST